MALGIEMTDNQRKRVQYDWEKLAGEPITIEQIGGAVYAFGSELACLRLEHTMRTGRAKYSENRESWTYTTER